jgi:hypothetical protein
MILILILDLIIICGSVQIRVESDGDASDSGRSLNCPLVFSSGPLLDRRLPKQARGRAGIRKTAIVCEICQESRAPDQFLRPWCGHSFCRDCFLGQIRAGIEMDKVQISCRYLFCQVSLSIEFIQRLSPELSQRLLQMQMPNRLSPSDCLVRQRAVPKKSTRCGILGIVALILGFVPAIFSKFITRA